MLRLLLVLIALIAPIAIANNCKHGLAYCGYNLLNIGNYQVEIDDALEADSLGTDASTGNNTLFNCIDSEGSIKVIRYCDHGCENGGSDESDYCDGEADATSSSTSAVSTTTSSTSVPASTTTSSTPSSGSSSSSTTNSSGGTPVGAIVGGVVGGIAAIGFVGLVAFLFLRLRAESRQQQQPEPSVSQGTMHQATPFSVVKAEAPATEYTMIHEAPNSDAQHELA